MIYYIQTNRESTPAGRLEAIRRGKWKPDNGAAVSCAFFCGKQGISLLPYGLLTGRGGRNMLTDRQKRFVGEYLIDLNATQAAIRAGYSRRNADKIGSELLGKTSVSRAVSRAMEARAQRTEIKQDRVIRELAAVAFSNASDYVRIVERQAVHTTDSGRQIPLFDSRGKPVMIQGVELVLTDSLTPEQKGAVSGIRQGKYGVEVTLCDKLRALELLGRHLGMFRDRVEVSGLDTEMSKLDILILEMGIKGAAEKE